MTEYVLCFVKKGDSILFVQKMKPKWQKGRFNLPGGKIEPGENPKQAAYRELFEETNLRASALRVCGKMTGGSSEFHGDGWAVYVVCCEVANSDCLQQKTDEPVKWMRTIHALHFSPIMPTLQVIIPLLLSKVEGWSMTCDDGLNNTLTLSL